MANVLPDIGQKATKIAYYDPYDIYEDVKDDLEARFPLVNLHWKPSDRPLRSIPTLEIELVEEEALPAATPQHQMLGLSQEPYLKLIFVKCEDNETYRHSLRKLIREWLSSNVIGLRDPTEWLIVHYVPKGSKSYTGNRFRSGVFDKIKADFNSGSKKDRCLQIRYGMSSEIESMELWSEITTRIKEGVLEAFGRRAELYQEEITKLEAKRNILGWNFGTFFVMKEGLALSFENISLFEDALLLYDDLEMAFNNFSTKSMPFLISIGFEAAPVPISVLSLYDNVSQVRNAILKSEISLFDFHCYLFSRQALLLLYISNSSSAASISALRVGELYSRLKTFITEMSGILLSNKKSPYMIAEWTYNVVREFYRYTESLQDGLARQVSEGRGQLLLLARQSLEILASGKGWVIKGVLNDIPIEYDDSYELHAIQNSELVESLKNDTLFYEKYRELTLAASAEFDLADRIRTVNLLSCELAVLEYNLGNFNKAAEILEGIPTLYSRQGWNLISTYLLSIYVECLQNLGRNKERILIHSLDLMNRHKYLDEKQILQAAKNIQDLSIAYQVQSNLEDYIKLEINPVTVGKCGVFEISANVTNLIRVPLEFDRGIMVLSNESDDILEYRCQKLLLNDKVTVVSFKAYEFKEGSFLIQSIVFFKGKITFKADFSNKNLIIPHYQQPDSVWGRLQVAPHFTLTDRQIALEIHCPCDIDEVKISFESEPGVRFVTQRAAIDKGFIKSNEAGRVVIKQLPIGQSLLTIPYMAAYDKKFLPILVTISFDNSSKLCTHTFRNTVDVGLVIDVSVQDYFKKKIYSRFVVTANDSPVRIHQVQSTSKCYRVLSPVGAEKSCIAFSDNPVSYAFSIQKMTDSNNDSFELKIKHGCLKNGKIYFILICFLIIG